MTRDGGHTATCLIHQHVLALESEAGTGLQEEAHGVGMQYL